MTAVPDRTTFETMYAGGAPWDIGRPQRAFIDAADQINGSVLDGRVERWRGGLGVGLVCCRPFRLPVP